MLAVARNDLCVMKSASNIALIEMYTMNIEDAICVARYSSPIIHGDA